MPRICMIVVFMLDAPSVGAVGSQMQGRTRSGGSWQRCNQPAACMTCWRAEVFTAARSMPASLNSSQSMQGMSPP